MIVFYGTRFGGNVDQHRGQYAATRYFHIYYLPLLPIGWMWVTARDGKLYRGHAIRPSWKSAAAGYLRTWGFAVGALAFGLGLNDGDPGAIVVGALLLCAAVWSFRWRHSRAEAAVERDLFQAASGSFCDPDLLPDEMIGRLRASLERAWAQRWPEIGPQDVARFGPREAAQVPYAYALLRVSARDAGRTRGRELRALARQLARREFARGAAVGDGPYREQTVGAPAAAPVGAQPADQSAPPQRQSP